MFVDRDTVRCRTQRALQRKKKSHDSEETVALASGFSFIHFYNFIFRHFVFSKLVLFGSILIFQCWTFAKQAPSFEDQPEINSRLFYNQTDAFRLTFHLTVDPLISSNHSSVSSCNLYNKHFASVCTEFYNRLYISSLISNIQCSMLTMSSNNGFQTFRIFSATIDRCSIGCTIEQIPAKRYT